jgi:hypothetical protein
MQEQTNLKGSQFNGFEFSTPEVWKSSVDFTKFHRALYRFTDYLNTFDQRVKTKKHPFAKTNAGPVEYIPIETLEQLLDETFYGLWCVTAFETKAVANEYVGSCVVSYFHPVARVWLHRTGAAAVLIKQNAWLTDEKGNYVKDAKGNKIKARPAPSDIDSKISNAMETSYPALLSGATSNAIKKIGRRFGRHLNRFEGYDIEEQTSQQARFFKAKPITDKLFGQFLNRLKEAQEAGDGLQLKELADNIEALYKLTPEQNTIFQEYKTLQINE